MNAQGNTIVIIGSQTLRVGGAPVTLPDGEVVSAGTSGLLMVGGGRISSVPYSGIPAPSTTTPVLGLATLWTESTFGDGPTATSSGQRGYSEKLGVRLMTVFVASFLVVVCLF